MNRWIFPALCLFIFCCANHAKTMWLKMRINDLQEQVQQLQTQLKLHSNPRLRLAHVTVTAYTASIDECDSTPQHTACLHKVKVGDVAVSRDLFKQGWVFGKKVYLYQYGVYTIKDLMHPRFKSAIDIYVGSKRQAKMLGKNKTLAVLLD